MVVILSAAKDLLVELSTVGEKILRCAQDDGVLLMLTLLLTSGYRRGRGVRLLLVTFSSPGGAYC